MLPCMKDEDESGSLNVLRRWTELDVVRCLFVSLLQKLEEQDRKALNVKEQLQREHRYLKRRLEQLSVSGSVERIRTDSMGSTISTDSEQGWWPPHLLPHHHPTQAPPTAHLHRSNRHHARRRFSLFTVAHVRIPPPPPPPPLTKEVKG